MAFRMLERTKTFMYFDFINEKGTFHQYHYMILIFFTEFMDNFDEIFPFH